MRPMNEAPKDGTAILARIRDDLDAWRPERAPWREAGIFVVVRHPGLAEDGFDIGWNLAGPFGNGGWTDEWFTGWWPLPDTQ